MDPSVHLSQDVCAEVLQDLTDGHSSGGTLVAHQFVSRHIFPTDMAFLLLVLLGAVDQLGGDAEQLHDHLLKGVRKMENFTTGKIVVNPMAMFHQVIGEGVFARPFLARNADQHHFSLPKTCLISSMLRSSGSRF